MIVIFEKEYLQELYETGKCSSKKHRYQPEIVSKFKDRINILKRVAKVESLFTINSLNYEVLKENKAGISSIRINKQYRIEFTVTKQKDEPAVTVCNIIELSNHYK